MEIFAKRRMVYLGKWYGMMVKDLKIEYKRGEEKGSKFQDLFAFLRFKIFIIPSKCSILRSCPLQVACLSFLFYIAAVSLLHFFGRTQ